ncbi:hypothetical protein PQ610_04010 [Tardisphaera miroshnichenkoae]
MSELNTHKAKRIASLIVSQYPDRFSSDFEKNKKSLDDLLIFPSKSMRNKVAGYITRIAKRAEGGPAEQGATVEESAEIVVAEQDEAKPAASEAPQQESEKKPKRERRSRKAQAAKTEKEDQQASAQPAATQETGAASAQATKEEPSPAAEEAKSEADQNSSQEKPG